MRQTNAIKSAADTGSQNIELALQAYMARKTDLRGGAALAGVSYQEFLHEVQEHNIVVLENDQFLEELDFLANAFDDGTLRDAVQKVREQDVIR